MIADGEVNGIFLADKFQGQCPSLFAKLREVLVSHGVEVRLLTEVKDIWARDYCPILVGPREFVKFQYTPDYLKACPHLRTGEEVIRSFADLGECVVSSIVLDGGNVVSSGSRAILTDKIYKENPSWERQELRLEIQRLLQVDHLIVVPKEPYDPFGHSDGMVRFVSESTVVVNDYSQADPSFGERLAECLQKTGLVAETIPYFCERYVRDGIQSAVGNYANFLRTKHVVVAPAYGHIFDQQAVDMLRALFPEVPVVPLDCTELGREGGVLNCITANFQCAGRN